MSDDDKTKSPETEVEGGEGGEAPVTKDELSTLAEEMGTTPEKLVKKVKNLRQWESEVNARHQATLAKEKAKPESKPSTQDGDDELSSLSPEARKILSRVISEEVGPALDEFRQRINASATEVVEDFLDENKSVTQQELFEVMNREGLWPDEKELTPRLLKRRLSRAKKILEEDDFDEDDFREKIRAEELEKLRSEGVKITDVQKRGGGAPPKKETPKNWVERMSAHFDE